jgi:hypothetical protein
MIPKKRPAIQFKLALAVFWTITHATILAKDPPGFNRDVLPILSEHCFVCHGQDNAKREAGLRLDQRPDALSELKSGRRAIVAGDLLQSELWSRITSNDNEHCMPPPSTGKRISSEQLATLRAWIEHGAQYEPHWAFVPPIANDPPWIDGTTHPIDRFILGRLAQEQLSPSQPASRATLIRRASLDLTGLPPTPQEVDAFLNDNRRDAFERVVDRLIASEHFGERWGRWWLDLAHYADSDGYLQDFIRPVAWRYRQWVVDALNRDMPFDQFTIEQIAGDLIPDATVSQRMGTGFFRNTLSNREGGADLEEFRIHQVIDRTMTLSTTWLALTTGCAQCHDHKFDAITQREYYQLFAFLNNADEVNMDAPLPGEREAYEPAKAAFDAQRAAMISPIATPLAELQSDWETRLLYAETHPNEDFAWDRTLELLGLQWGQSLGEGQLEGLNIIKTQPSLRTQDQQDRLRDYFLRSAPSVYNDKLKELKIGELNSKLESMKKLLPSMTRAPGMMSFPHRRATHLFVRGEYRRKGEEVFPGTPSALPPLPVHDTPDRLTLAKWLVSPEHPLTARVVVNRLWQELFGRGIVATSENFGVRGQSPSHPELLDWLAIHFQEHRWSIKEIVRLIVTSQAYRQSSEFNPVLATRDPNNTLLARQSRMRLSAEVVRDSALAASGLLNRTLGGPSVKPPQPASVSKEGYSNSWEPSRGADRYRRGLYTFIQRTSPFAQLVAFDWPDSSRSCTRRERSNTPIQSLHLLNDPVFLEAATAMAARVHRESRGADEQQLQHAFLLCLSRPPKPDESKRLLNYLQQQREIFHNDIASSQALSQNSMPGTDPAWIAVCSVLLNLDEFINRE